MREHREYDIRRLFFAAICALQLCCNAAVASGQLLYNNKQWLSLSADSLLKMARAHSGTYEASDTAVVCYTILTERYSPQMNREDKLHCVEAYHGLWNIYFLCHSDYATSFEMLSKAISILDSMGEERIDIDLDMGAMYLTVGGGSEDSELKRRAVDYFRKAFSLAMRTKGEEAKAKADVAMINMLVAAWGLGKIDSIDAEWNTYKTQRLGRHGGKDFKPQFASNLHKFYKAMEKSNFSVAKQAINCQIAAAEHQASKRYLYMSLLNKCRLYRACGQPDSAIVVIKQAEGVANRLGMKDCLIGVYAYLDTLYHETGQTELRELYRDKFYQLNDTLTNYRQLKWVGQMEARGRISDVSRQVHELMATGRKQSNLINTLTLVAVIVIVFTVILLVQNRRLKATNRSLYSSIQETILAEEHKFKLQRKLADTDNTTAPPHRQQSMADEDRQALLDNIEQVMETNAEIFSTDFSIERLSALVGSKYRYVSQVINDQYGCNFNVYLGKYRIREACKRLSDVNNYGHYTFEAIANSVGFKSRSAFAQSFKRVTGLTPSEYKSIAESEQKG